MAIAGARNRKMGKIGKRKANNVNSVNVSLSKGVLEMKFMKRTKERLQREALEAKSAALVCVAAELCGDVPKAAREPSIGACLDLIDGRVSFGGFNPVLEALMKPKNTQETAEVAEISDRELAEAFDPRVRKEAADFLAGMAVQLDHINHLNQTKRRRKDHQ